MTNGTSLNWEAIARQLAGEAGPDEVARIEAALAASPDEKRAIESLGQIVARVREDSAGDVAVEAALEKVRSTPGFSSAKVTTIGSRSAELDTPPPRRWFVSMPALAAAAWLAVGAASWMAYNNRPREQATTAAPRMLATGVGVRDSMLLSDGSRIILGPLSSAKISSGYGRDARMVEIRGEAWFDVIHDASRPFIVQAGAATITDIGTTFAVRTDGSEGVAVSVTEGSVSLQQPNTSGGRAVVLKAGDTGLLRENGEIVAKKGAANEDDAAWLHGRLVFRDAPIGDVATALKKWYGLELSVADTSLSQVHLTATFSGEPVSRVLDVIGLALGAEIERRGDTAIVHMVKGSTRSK